jgi:hypothetical protein
LERLSETGTGTGTGDGVGSVGGFDGGGGSDGVAMVALTSPRSIIRLIGAFAGLDQGREPGRAGRDEGHRGVSRLLSPLDSEALSGFLCKF